MATFAAQPQDENLIPGWNVQGNNMAVSTVGVPGPGYASPAAIPAAATYTGTGSQPGAGLPYPPKAEDIGSENDGASGQTILTNPGYQGVGISPSAAPVTTPVVTTAGVQNPFGLAAEAIFPQTTSITSVYVCPFQATGQPSGTSSPWAQVITAAPASTVTVTVTVPPAGYIKTVGANAGSTTWTPTF